MRSQPRLNNVPSCALWVGLFALTLYSTNVLANESTICFNFPVESVAAHDHEEQRFERWCYERENSVSKKVYIYNVDENRVRPEVAMIVDENGIMTHGSLLQGNVTIHKVDTSEFNPFNIPLTEPTHLQGYSLTTTESSQLTESARAVKKQLQLAEASETLFRPSIGTFASSAATPWRGYWFPRSSMKMLVPLSKYDKFVRARGKESNLVGTEKARHYYKGVSWEGHCNGWAAATILRAEPRSVKTDSVSGVTFSISDQKGLLTELDYCASAVIFGKRNRGAGNNGDIRPELFHRTLLHYIGSLRKPIAMDRFSTPSVDNHVIGGYKMNMIKVSANRYKVTMNVTVHQYDKDLTENVGPAPTYLKTFSYYLTTDASGKAIGGSWISTNPDFLWAPSAPKSCTKIPIDGSTVLSIVNL